MSRLPDILVAGLDRVANVGRPSNRVNKLGHFMTPEVIEILFIFVFDSQSTANIFDYFGQTHTGEFLFVDYFQSHACFESPQQGIFHLFRSILKKNVYEFFGLAKFGRIQRILLVDESPAGRSCCR